MFYFPILVLACLSIVKGSFVNAGTANFIRRIRQEIEGGSHVGPSWDHLHRYMKNHPLKKLSNSTSSRTSTTSKLQEKSLETDMTTDSFMQYTETTAAQEIESRKSTPQQDPLLNFFAKIPRRSRDLMNKGKNKKKESVQSKKDFKNFFLKSDRNTTYPAKSTVWARKYYTDQTSLPNNYTAFQNKRPLPGAVKVTARILVF